MIPSYRNPDLRIIIAAAWRVTRWQKWYVRMLRLNPFWRLERRRAKLAKIRRRQLRLLTELPLKFPLPDLGIPGMSPELERVLGNLQETAKRFSTRHIVRTATVEIDYERGTIRNKTVTTTRE